MTPRTRRRPGVGSPDATKTADQATLRQPTAPLSRRPYIERCSACGAAALGVEPVHAPWCARVGPIRAVAELEVVGS